MGWVFHINKSVNSSKYFRAESKSDERDPFSRLITYVNSSPSSNVIASAECLSKHKLSSSHFDRLNMSLGNIFFVACLRDPAEWAVSHVQQIQKLKGKKGLENDSLSPHYEDVVTHYQSLTKNVILINFEDLITAKEGVTCSFLLNLMPPQSNIPKELINLGKKYNSSLCHEAIEVLNYMYEMNLVDKQNFPGLLRILRSWKGVKFKPSHELAQQIENSIAGDHLYYRTVFPSAKPITSISSGEKPQLDEYLLQKLSEILIR